MIVILKNLPIAICSLAGAQLYWLVGWILEGGEEQWGRNGDSCISNVKTTHTIGCAHMVLPFTPSCTRSKQLWVSLKGVSVTCSVPVTCIIPLTGATVLVL